MDTSRIQEIILKVNGNDAEKTINRIKSVIENARKEKEKLAKEDTSKWGDKEWKRRRPQIFGQRLPQRA